MIKARPQAEFHILAANTAVRELPIDQLENIHLIGALDLGQAFDEARRLTSWSVHTTHLLPLGAGWASLGERNPERLLAKLPKSARSIAASVGLDVNQQLIDQLAEKTGGISANILDGSDLLRLERRSPKTRSPPRNQWNPSNHTPNTAVVRTSRIHRMKTTTTSHLLIQVQ